MAGYFLEDFQTFLKDDMLSLRNMNPTQHTKPTFN